MKTTVFWDIVQFSFIALMMEAVSTSETSVNFYETTQRNIPEGCHLYDKLTLLRGFEVEYCVKR
jgi:hypothetical protein